MAVKLVIKLVISAKIVLTSQLLTLRNVTELTETVAHIEPMNK